VKLLLLTCVVACTGAAWALQDPAPMVKESATGIEFPAWIRAPLGGATDLTLCLALFDVYVGADPISSGAKDSFRDGAWRLAEKAFVPPAVPTSSR